MKSLDSQMSEIRWVHKDCRATLSSAKESVYWLLWNSGEICRTRRESRSWDSSGENICLKGWSLSQQAGRWRAGQQPYSKLQGLEWALAQESPTEAPAHRNSRSAQRIQALPAASILQRQGSLLRNPEWTKVAFQHWSHMSDKRLKMMTQAAQDIPELAGWKVGGI